MNDCDLDIFGRLHIKIDDPAFESRIRIEKCICSLLGKKRQSYSVSYDHDVVIIMVGEVCLKFRTNTSIKRSHNASPISLTTIYIAYSVGNDSIKRINEGIFSKTLKLPVKSIVNKLIKKAKSP